MYYRIDYMEEAGCGREQHRRQKGLLCLTGASLTMVNPNVGSGISRLRVWGTMPSLKAKTENAASREPETAKYVVRGVRACCL